jgi:signal transduction histidine kinase
MTRRSTEFGTNSSVRLIWLLVGSFVLTIGSFVAATLLPRYEGHKMTAAASSIATDAVPSIACVTNARTELRKIERALEGTAAAFAPEQRGRSVDSDGSNLRQSRDALGRAWAECALLPMYPGERALQNRVAASIGEMNASIDDVLRNLEDGDRPRAIAEVVSQTKPAIDKVDAGMVEGIELKARQSEVLGAQVVSLAGSIGSTLYLLVGLSTLLTATAAIVLALLLRRFTTLMTVRVTEMELFASRVAHDVVSPLAAVGLALELTKRNPESALKKGMLDRAISTLHRVGELVDGLLLFARAGAAPRDGTQANVGEVLGGLVDGMCVGAEENGITLELEPPKTSLVVACSSGVLLSIVSNLIENAIKYMGSSPVRRVKVRTREDARGVCLEVCDTGPGIATALRERIFDPYVRGGNTTVQGIGLGLATVRRLVEAHGGSTGVLPNEGTGSIFWFELPKAEVGAKSADVVT